MILLHNEDWLQTLDICQFYDYCCPYAIYVVIFPSICRLVVIFAVYVAGVDCRQQRMPAEEFRRATESQQNLKGIVLPNSLAVQIFTQRTPFFLSKVSD